jgi:carbonic anhydrase
MDPVKDLLDRNGRFAEAGRGELPPLPARGVAILTCMDHRIDPAAALGLELGDAMVIRNAGGRVTPSFIKNLEILDLVTGERGSGLHELELILMQHTGCGSGNLAMTHPDRLADYFEIAPEDLSRKSAAEPHEGVRIDLEALAAAPSVPDTLCVTGLVYETDTGRVEVVERRAPLRDRA